MVEVLEGVTVRVATVPFGIPVEFKPDSMHSIEPDVFTAHCTVLPA
jgi:hypothetical protein